MELEVVGRHALLFDDDGMAAFVNSKEALVEWNSLLIDRYDVRHLLSSPPPPRSKRRHANLDDDDAVLAPQLDRARYLDLPPDSPPLFPSGLQDSATEPAKTQGYHAVGLSYGNNGESVDEKDTDSSSNFHPPFPVPDALLQNLPPNEKVHQIIARTATFVNKHGGQSEIILRVKQGDNPTFGFLMPDHHLHAYFRFLVDHPEFFADKSPEEENKAESGLGQASGPGGGGALWLLGSVYGTEEDEDTKTEAASESKRKTHAEGGEASVRIDVTGSEGAEVSKNFPERYEMGIKHTHSSLKDKNSVIKRNPCVSTAGAGRAIKGKKECDLSDNLSIPLDKKSKSSVLSSPATQVMPILEPTTELKRVIDKIVEFILRNGKEFEAVLAEQDVKHGRFPFLLPTNLYHPYYRKVLQKAEEAKLSSNGNASERQESAGKSNDTPSVGTDIPDDLGKKEKFKMVIAKSKKDGPEQPPSKPSQPEVGISVDAAAAILQAARRGIRNPNLHLFAGTEGPQKSTANEADSSEAGLTRDQKLKAERLKRAKMFVAMIKRGAAPMKAGPSRSMSLEPTDSGVSGSGTTDMDPTIKEREGSSVSLDGGMESEKGKVGDDYNRKRPKRKYRSRLEREEVEEEMQEAVEGKIEKEDTGERNNKRSKKRHRHRHHSSREKHKHKSKHSSSKDRDERDGHGLNNSDDDDYQLCQHRRQGSSRRPKDEDECSSDTEHRSDHSRSRKHKRRKGSGDEHERRRRSRKHKRSRSKVEGESDSKSRRAIDGEVGEASVELPKSCSDERTASQPDTTGEVSEDLRAKVRAMLMANM